MAKILYEKNCNEEEDQNDMLAASKACQKSDGVTVKPLSHNGGTSRPNGGSRTDDRTQRHGQEQSGTNCPLRTTQTNQNNSVQLNQDTKSIAELFRVPSATTIANAQSRIKLQLLSEQKKKSTIEPPLVEPPPLAPTPVWRRAFEILDCTRVFSGVRSNSQLELCNGGKCKDINDAEVEGGNVDAIDGEINNDKEIDFEYIEQYLHMNDYTGGFMTDQGGRLSIANSGVTLFVPEGALPKGKVQFMELTLQQCNTTTLVNDNEAWLTPNVQAGPLGFEFDKDVFYIIPHCASNIDQWNVSHYSNRTSNWSTSKEGDNLVIQQSDSIVVCMDRLCDQKLSGCVGDYTELQTKEMAVSVYLEEGADKDRKLKIFLSNPIEKHTRPQPNKNQTYSPTTTRTSSKFYCQYTHSQTFMSDARFRNLCNILDYLEAMKLGWTVLAEALNVDLDPSEVRAVKRQKQMSPSAIFLSAYFKKMLDDKMDTVDTLTAIREACKESLVSVQPMSIVDEEIGEKESQQLCETEFLGIGTVRISDCQEDIWITVSDENEDDDIAEETDKMVPFKKAWGGTEELCVTFDVSAGDVSAAIRVQQADDENNGLLMSVKIPQNKSSKKSRKISRIVSNDADDTSIDSDDISIISSSGDLLEELGISQKDRLALELRSKKRGRSFDDILKDLYEALKGHEPYFEDSSSSDESDTSCEDDSSSEEEDAIDSKSDDLSECSEAAMIPEVNAKSELSGADNIAGFSSDDLDTEGSIDKDSKPVTASLSDKSENQEPDQRKSMDVIDFGHKDAVPQRNPMSSYCGEASGTVNNEAESKSLIMVNENINVEGRELDAEKDNAAFAENSDGSRGNNSEWPINPLRFVSWIKEKFQRKQCCNMPNMASKHETNPKQNRQTQNNYWHSRQNLNVHDSEELLVQNNDHYIDGFVFRRSGSAQHPLSSLEDIDVELLARKLSHPGTIPESNV